LKAVDLYAINPKQDSEELEDSPDYAGIEVVRRRNSLTPTTTSYGKAHSTHHSQKYVDPISMMPVHKYSGSQYQGPSQAYLPSSDIRREYGYHPDVVSPRSSVYPEKQGKIPGEGGHLDDDRTTQSYLPSLAAKPSRKRYNPQAHGPPQATYAEGSNATLHDHKPSEDCKEIPIWSPYLAHQSHQRPDNLC
jgi:hypothetical protein